MTYDTWKTTDPNDQFLGPQPEGDAMKGSDVFPSNWLKAADLNGHEVNVVIDRVVIEEIGNSGDRKPVIYFKGKEKGLVCNKTNWDRIAYILKSDESDDWKGKRVRLYMELVQFQGQMKEALRVKAAPVETMTGTRPQPQPQRTPVQQESSPNDFSDDPIPF